MTIRFFFFHGKHLPFYYYLYQQSCVYNQIFKICVRADRHDEKVKSGENILDILVKQEKHYQKYINKSQLMEKFDSNKST